jgi:hypothetical protein
MLHPQAHGQSPATIVGRGLPSLGIVLAVTGLLLLGAETGIRSPMVAAPRMASHPLADVATTNRDVPSRSSGGKATAWAAISRQPAAMGSGNQWRSEAAPFRLTMQLTRGDRGESAHLAAIPLPGDPRQTLLRMAALQHMRSRPDFSPSWATGAHGSPDVVTSEDRIAHAFYGPAA